MPSCPLPEPPTSDRRPLLEQARLQRVDTLRNLLAAVRGGVGWGGPATLELGCGHGHFLAAYALAHPDRAAIGLDFCRERIRRAERKRLSARLPRLHFLHAEAGEFLQAVPDTLRFARIFILFPDPWPKRRHRKNRLVSAGFLERLASVSEAGAELCLRTDHDDYFAATRSTLLAAPDWRLEPARPWPFEAATVFQQKAAAHHSLVAVKAPRA